MLGFADAEALQRSFQEFARQPQHRDLVLQAQREELCGALDAQEAAMQAQLRAQVGGCRCRCWHGAGGARGVRLGRIQWRAGGE